MAVESDAKLCVQTAFHIATLVPNRSKEAFQTHEALD